MPSMLAARGPWEEDAYPSSVLHSSRMRGSRHCLERQSYWDCAMPTGSYAVLST